MEIPAHFFNNLNHGVLVTDSDPKIAYVNPAFEQITGYSLSEIKGKSPAVLSSGKQDKTFYQQLWDQLTSTGSWQGEIWNKRKDGKLYLEWLSICAVYNDTEKIEYYMGIFTDITQQKMREADMDYYAYHDSLTGLYNLRYVSEHGSSILQNSHQRNGFCAIVYIDFDYFKLINDRYGHDTGDQFLIHGIKILQKWTRESDLIARIGGDEFLIILNDLKHPAEANDLLQRIKNGLDRDPFIIGDNDQITISVSMGVSFSEHDRSWELFLKQADEAMYQAKAAGRNTINYYRRSS